MTLGMEGNNATPEWIGRSRRFASHAYQENLNLQEFQGQIIDDNTNISTSVRRSYTAGDSLVRTKTLYSSSFEIPPERKTDPG
jgi:hypothetical protein